MSPYCFVVEAYRLGKYDNLNFPHGLRRFPVWRGGSNVEAYRLGKYDNKWYRLRSDLIIIGHKKARFLKTRNRAFYFVNDNDKKYQITTINVPLFLSAKKLIFPLLIAD